MDATLILNNIAKAFSDDLGTQQPLMNPVDWKGVVQVPVKNASTVPYTIPPGATKSIFSSAETTGIDGTTQFTLTLSPLVEDRYRFTASAGTSPAFRTDRALALSGHQVTVAVNSNQTVTMTSDAGMFSAVQAGDTVFVPGISTGDAAGAFNGMNEGLWTVLAVATGGASIQLGRPVGATFFAIGETVAITANSQIMAYSAAGIQVGDSVKISAGFIAPVLGSYQIVAVTPKWFEVVTTLSLPVSVVATPGATGMAFYTSLKRWLRIVSDQEIVPYVNGQTDDSNRTTPWSAGDKTMMGDWQKSGPVFSLSIANASQQPANVVVMSAE